MVMYQLPSSVMVIPNDKGEVETEELRKAVESLDNKFEALVKKIVGIEEGEDLGTSFVNVL